MPFRGALRRPHHEQANPMSDVVFLVLGLGAFALMALYARWAAGA